jgi:hypothetical protein
VRLAIYTRWASAIATSSHRIYYSIPKQPCSNCVILAAQRWVDLFEIVRSKHSFQHLVRGEPNVSYICSRYYRAPELIFGATDYQTNIGAFNLHFSMRI